MISCISRAINPGGYNCPALDRYSKSSLTTYPCGNVPKALDVSCNGSRTVDVAKDSSRTINPVLGIVAGTRIIKHEVIKNPVIKHGPEIGNWGSHNNQYGSHDNKSTRRTL